MTGFEYYKKLKKLKKLKNLDCLAADAFCCLSVTVVAPTAMESDALSAAVFVMGAEKGKALLKKIPGTSCITFEDEWLTR